MAFQQNCELNFFENILTLSGWWWVRILVQTKYKWFLLDELSTRKWLIFCRVLGKSCIVSFLKIINIIGRTFFK